MNTEYEYQDNEGLTMLITVTVVRNSFHLFIFPLKKSGSFISNQMNESREYRNP